MEVELDQKFGDGGRFSPREDDAVHSLQVVASADPQDLALLARSLQHPLQAVDVLRHVPLEADDASALHGPRKANGGIKAFLATRRKHIIMSKGHRSAMGDGVPPDLEKALAGIEESAMRGEEAPKINRRAVRRELKELDARWDSEVDSEALWEKEHELLLKLQQAGDASTVMNRVARARDAKDARACARDLADTALGLWVMERFDEAEKVLRVAIERFPVNRYPWSLLLRHVTWGRDPQEAMDFILASLDRVPWRAYSLVQLGTLSVDAASRSFKGEAFDECRRHLKAARGYLEQVAGDGNAMDEHRRTSDRLLALVEALEKRTDTAEADAAARAAGSEELAAWEKDDGERLERDMMAAAKASGVMLEGEPDTEIDIDEIERASRMEMPEEDPDRKTTVLEVTPSRGFGLKRKKGEKVEERKKEEKREV